VKVEENFDECRIEELYIYIYIYIYTNINLKIEESNEWKIKEIKYLYKEKFADFLKISCVAKHVYSHKKTM